MKRVMISQPMRGLSEEEILARRDKAAKFLEEKGYDVINTFLDDDFKEPEGCVNHGLAYLAESIKLMSTCDAVCFLDGCMDARGCRIESEAAFQYGLTRLHLHNI